MKLKNKAKKTDIIISFDALEKRKQLELQKQKIRRSRFNTSDTFPVSGITEEGFVKLNINGKTYYVETLKCRNYDIRFMSEPDKKNLIVEHAQINREYGDSLKQIFARFPENNNVQQEYVKLLLNKSKSNQRNVQLLQTEMNKLKYLEENSRTMKSWFQVFGESVDELTSNLDKLSEYTLHKFTPISPDQKVLLYATLNGEFEPKLKPFDMNSPERDIDFVLATQPKGGVTFKDEFCVRYGKSYTATLTIIDRPQTFNPFWLTTLTDFLNSTVFVDTLTPPDSDNVKTKVSKSVSELTGQMNRASNQTQYDSLYTDREELRWLYNDIEKNGEQMKYASIRIVLQAYSKEELEKQVNEIGEKLNKVNYEGQVFLEENDEAYQSMFIPMNEIMKLPSKRKGLLLPASVLGKGFAHDETSLSDRRGSFLGRTFSGGLMYFDSFAKTLTRMSYSAFISGESGAGKSTTLKKMTFDRAIKSDMIRIIGLTKEFVSLVNYFDGTIINLDGSDGIVNMLQVFGNVVNDDGTINVRQSFSTFLSDFGIKYQMADPTVSSNTKKVLVTLLQDFYTELGLFGPNAKVPVTSLAENQYPILSDFRKYLIKRKETEKDELTSLAISEIMPTFNNLIDTYGHMFDGHTNFKNVSDVQMVLYNTAGVMKLDSSIRNLCIFNTLNQINSDCSKLGTQEFMKYNQRIKTMDVEDALDLVRHFLIIVDECHNYLNLETVFAATFFANLLAECRKLFGGVWFATQKLETMFPNADNLADGGMVKAANELSRIYSLCAYKVLLRHSDESLRVLRKIFSQTLTDTELSLLPAFSRGQGILSITGDQNILMQIEISDFEDQLFEGGA